MKAPPQYLISRPPCFSRQPLLPVLRPSLLVAESAAASVSPAPQICTPDSAHSVWPFSFLLSRHVHTFSSPDSGYLQLESLVSSAAKLGFHADLRWAHAPFQELQHFLCRTQVCSLQPSDQGPCSPVAHRSYQKQGAPRIPSFLTHGWLHVCVQLLRREQPFPLFPSEGLLSAITHQ